MLTVAIVLFCIATVFSVMLMPNNFSLLPLMTLSAGRALALVLALLFWVGSGRLDAWSSSRLLQCVMVVLGAAALTGGCFFIQMTRDDNVPDPYPLIYRVSAALLPLCFMAGALLPSKKLFLAMSVLSPLAGIVTISTWKPLNEQFNANRPKSKEQQEYDDLMARRTADLERVPATAGPESLVEFINPAEPYDIRTKALARIEQTPDWVARLAPLLDGENRLKVCYVLSRRAASLPDDVAERCWTVAASFAKDRTELLKKGTPTPEAEQQTLHDSVMELGNAEPARQKHWKEIGAVEDFFVAAKTPINTAIIDFWARQTQLRQIPEDAGIVPLLDFVGQESWDVKQEALARIDKVPDSTAKLTELLDGPHRLGAVVVLAHHADTLPNALLEHCWQAAAASAQAMNSDIAQGKPPARSEVRKLIFPVGAFWNKLGPDRQKSRLTDLAAVRDAVRAAGGEFEKIDFGWADQVLATPAQSPANQRQTSR